MKRSPVVSRFILTLPKHQRELTIHLRTLLHQYIPFAEETFKYNTPFYTYKGLLCYISTTPHGIYLGLCKGFRHSDPEGILEGKKLKQIRHIVVDKRSDIKKRLFKEYLQEAVILNEQKKDKLLLKL